METRKELRTRRNTLSRDGYSCESMQAHVGRVELALGIEFRTWINAKDLYNSTPDTSAHSSMRPETRSDHDRNPCSSKSFVIYTFTQILVRSHIFYPPKFWLF